MKLAFSKPTRGQDELEELFSSYRESGFEGLQLKMGQFIDYLGKPDAFRERWGDDPGHVSALIFFAPLGADGEARLAEVIDFAAAVGSERVVFCHDHGHDGVSRSDRQAIARLLSGHGRRARDMGVALSLHHHYDQPVMLAEDAAEFFDAVEDETVGLTVDTGHLAKSGIDDVAGFVAEFSSVIDNIHLKDYEDGQWRLLGEGRLPLSDGVAELRRLGFAGWLCVDEESSASLADGLDASRRWLERHEQD